MARSVSLSDEAFTVLRREKRPHESDSDVVLRLHRTAHRKRRDPVAFFAHLPRPDLTPEQYAEVREKMRTGDRRRWDPEA